ncbi:hypothetical protein [Nonomuraea jiangxiensis]|uniref:Uncharacterized protein n=1 Tax=Nonomuraea jiangxiensis TaxID=633440 RepID=A0A1G9DBY2_9ACTN|nr:hypothetical protein [Nonomuraea jiangxiensis]SDK61379.1 hypothetical protein SAMN05421869_11777 [Nonomuraea jiangxiensis]
MRSSLIAAGGALLAAAALYGTAGTAAAGTWKDGDSHYPQHCDIGVNDDSTYHHVTHQGVFAGTREADGCKNWDHKHKHKHHGWGEDHWLHRNWPTSGNGNWVGHGLGPGAGIGVGR